MGGSFLQCTIAEDVMIIHFHLMLIKSGHAIYLFICVLTQSKPIFPKNM